VFTRVRQLTDQDYPNAEGRRKWLLNSLIVLLAHVRMWAIARASRQSGADGYISKPVVDHQQFVDQIPGTAAQRLATFLLGISRFKQNYPVGIMSFYFSAYKIDNVCPPDSYLLLVYS